MATKKIIVDPQRDRKLAELETERAQAHRRVGAAFKTDPPGLILEGTALRRLQKADADVADIMRRIRELRG